MNYLYGLEPGKDLSAKFCVRPTKPCLPVYHDGTSSLLYRWGKSPTDIDSYFAEGTWMQTGYTFTPIEMPKESTGEITFTITFPAKRQLFFSNWKGKNSDNLNEPPLEDVVY